MFLVAERVRGPGGIQCAIRISGHKGDVHGPVRACFMWSAPIFQKLFDTPGRTQGLKPAVTAGKGRALYCCRLHSHRCGGQYRARSGTAGRDGLCGAQVVDVGEVYSERQSPRCAMAPSLPLAMGPVIAGDVLGEETTACGGDAIAVHATDAAALSLAIDR